MTTNLKTKWDLSPLLDSDNDPRIESFMDEVKAKNAEFVTKWKDNEDYLKDPKTLKQALDEYEELHTHYGFGGRVGYYFYLRSKQELNNPELKAQNNKLDDISTKLGNDMAFFTHRLSKIDEKTQKQFLESKLLQDYKHFLQNIFEAAKYLLSEEEEKILNIKAQVSHTNWVKMVSGLYAKEEAIVLDEDGKKVKKNMSDIGNLTKSKNKEVRDYAAKVLTKLTKKHIDIAENEMNSILQNKKTTDELRKYPRPDFARHLSDEIDTDVIDTLVESVTSRFDLAHEYFKLKAELHGVEKLTYFERNLEYGDTEIKYSFEDSIKLVRKTFEQLDPEFAIILDKYLAEGRFDVFPETGKYSNPFHVHYLKSLPNYILLCHHERLDDVLTIAHEMGHAINAVLSKQKQNSLHVDYSVAVAEVASTFMEDFVLQELVKEANDQVKLELLMKKLSDCIVTIIRQIAGYNFETELHKEFATKGYLSKEDIGSLYKKNMDPSLGPAVDTPKDTAIFWAVWPHIRDFFYIYSYSSGLLISMSLQNLVKKDPTKIKLVKEFLAAGGSKSTKDIFLDLGIDISKKEFWHQGLKEIENILEETKALAKKLGKIK